MRLLFLFILCFIPNLFFAQEGIMLQSVNGKQAIKHSVQAGETLYSIAKRYNTTVDHIKKDNPNLLQNDLTINTTIVIYYNKQMLADISKADPNRCLSLLHRVKKGETLFGIAKRTYDIDVADLKLWNRLNSNEISIGQNLIVGWLLSDVNYGQDSRTVASQNPVMQAGSVSESSVNTETKPTEETGRIVYVSKGMQTGDLKDSKVYTSPKDPFSEVPKRVDEIVTADKEKLNPIDSTPVRMSEETPMEKTDVQPVISEAPVMENDKRLARDIFDGFAKDTSGKYSLQKERGAAKWFKPTDGSIQLYAKHKTAPVGTILKIANPINNYTVYVKVIQQLPNSDENQNALLKISSNAMELLKVYDKVFMVDVSYYKPN